MFGRIWSDELLGGESRQMLRDATEEYFKQQQQIRLREIWTGKRPSVDWVHDQLTQGGPPENGLALAARDIVKPYGHTLAAECWRSASRLLLPRAELDRSRLERRIARVLRDAPANDLPDRVTRLIEGTIGRCRRWWPDLPTGVSAISQRVRHGCSALESLDGGWWLEGLVRGPRLLWGTAELTDAQIKQFRPTIKNGRWHCRVDRVALPESIAAQFQPRPHLRYAAPPAWWAGAA
jgi:hypothetical protein